jgi:cytochrome c peroxidase
MQIQGEQSYLKKKADIGKFKVPTLRNVDLTFPYMHNGSFESLEDVIKHYEAGGQKSETQSHLITGFELTDNERQNLLDFLSSLTEYRYLQINE